eukprot:TRINITY_DN1716_c0_g1_i7.p1 TRINITY_DN1716_c0_g1~~TRINITY_DN1716_c0_g1_i7.p1  ORF type:complete len:198 (+),score=21.01 TRINITY_DN1716_c0_g1_i7:739-1332(+)
MGYGVNGQVCIVPDIRGSMGIDSLLCLLTYSLADLSLCLSLSLSLSLPLYLDRRGFTPIIPPDLIRPNIVEGCGFSPRGEHSQIYHVQDNPLCLAATSEISLAGLHANSIIASQDLPLRYAAVSHCFRHEAGGAGSASRGLYRLHQFSKIEMFGLCAEDKSDHLLQEFLDIQIQLYQELGLPFRVLNMATEELGAPA